MTGVSPKSLGAETVRVIAPYAKTIIVASRSRERSVSPCAISVERIYKVEIFYRTTQTIDDILKEAPSAKIKFVALDLTSEESIRSAAAEVVALDIPLHVIRKTACFGAHRLIFPLPPLP